MNTLEDRWKFEKVDINLIDEADINANKMSDDDFKALCENIGVSGLSSVPTCYKKEDGRFSMISGHHRLRACKKMHYSKIGILYVEESELSEDERIAIQLSHNSLHGEDDKNILKLLFAQIKSVDFKKFAHVNMDEIGSLDTNSLSFIPLQESYSFAVVLYADSVDSFTELIGDIKELSAKNNIVMLADGDKNEDLFLKLKKEIRDKYEIKSSNEAFAKILELAHARLIETKGGEKE